MEPVDKAKGEFVIHFLPLEVDPNDSSPKGFNGGHLHHPIHDPSPRGLGLETTYVTEKAETADGHSTEPQAANAAASK
jgi:hypothetical protein